MAGWGGSWGAQAPRPPIKILPVKVVAQNSPFHKPGASGPTKVTPVGLKVNPQNAMELKRNQGVATLKVRKVIQKVRNASIEDFESLCTELEEAQIESMEAMGSMGDTVRQEAERALEQGRERVEKLQGEQDVLEAKKIEAEVRRETLKAEALEKKQAEEDRIVGLSQECEALVDISESALEKVKEAAKPEALAGSAQDILDAIEAIEKAIVEAKDANDEAMKAVPAKQKELGRSGNALKFRDWMQKLRSGTTALDKHRVEITPAKERAGRLQKCVAREKVWKTAFAKHDKDKDGKLSRTEILEFAKAQYDFAPTADCLDKLLKKLANDGKGVPYERFRGIRALVSIEKSAVKAREQRATDEAEEQKRTEEKKRKDAELAATKEQINEVLSGAKESFAAVKDAVFKASQTSHKLKTDKLKSDEFLQAVADANTQVDSAQAVLDEAEKKLTEKLAAIGADSDESIATLKTSLSAMDVKRIANMKDQLKKVTDAVKASEGRVQRMLYSEMEPLRHEVASCVCEILSSKADSTCESLLKGAGANLEAFTKFIRSLSDFLPSKDSLPSSLSTDTLSDSNVERLFRLIAGKDNDAVPSEKLVESLSKAYFKTAKSTILTEDQDVKSKNVRRIEDKEVVQALALPQVDAATSVTRVKCRVTSGDETSEGWVTVSGNKGTIFLTPWSRYLSCVKESTMSQELSIDSKSVRKVKVGEVYESGELPRKDSSGIMRTRCTSVSDGATGWVSVATSAGIAFLEPC